MKPSVPFRSTTTHTAPARINPPAGRSTRAEVVGFRHHGGKGLITIPSSKHRFTVGSGEDCDIVLADRYVSTTHCVFERSNQRLKVTDSGSKNGTLINGNRIHAAELVPGSILTIGSTRLVAVSRENRAERSAVEMLLGEDPIFRRAIESALRAAVAPCNILIVGETGTGKELVARAIHDASPRGAAPYIPVNCGAFPRELVASELFGHVAGAFTGANADRDGCFAAADGGTLFLDEIGELPRDLQPHLLRALEAGTIRPVGSTSERPVDVRTIAATNQLADLGTKESVLRMDLFHRLATISINLPPLRERRGDIPLLVRAFLEEITPRLGPRTLGAHALRYLVDRDWQGNVRELRHTVHRGATMADYEIAVHHLEPGWNARPAPGLEQRTLLAPLSGQVARVIIDDALDLKRHELLLRDAMVDALHLRGSLRKAADELGMAKSTFCDKAKRLGIAIDNPRQRQRIRYRK